MFVFKFIITWTLELWLMLLHRDVYSQFLKEMIIQPGIAKANLGLSREDVTMEDHVSPASSVSLPAVCHSIKQLLQAVLFWCDWCLTELQLMTLTLTSSTSTTERVKVQTDCVMLCCSKCLTVLKMSVYLSWSGHSWSQSHFSGEFL